MSGTNSGIFPFEKVSVKNLLRTLRVVSKYSISALTLFLVGTGRLEHLVVFSFLHSFINQLFTHTSSIVAFAVNGSDRDDVPC